MSRAFRSLQHNHIHYAVLARQARQPFASGLHGKFRESLLTGFRRARKIRVAHFDHVQAPALSSASSALRIAVVRPVTAPKLAAPTLMLQLRSPMAPNGVKFRNET